MSILIKGMDMPTSCSVCWALDDYGDYPRCRITEEQRGYNFPIRQKRMDNCPLVPVPPHGRLIDADALRQSMYHEAFETDSPMQKWDSGCWIRYKMFERMEENAPTIIPAGEE